MLHLGKRLHYREIEVGPLVISPQDKQAPSSSETPFKLDPLFQRLINATMSGCCIDSRVIRDFSRAAAYAAAAHTFDSVHRYTTIQENIPCIHVARTVTNE